MPDLKATAGRLARSWNLRAAGFFTLLTLAFTWPTALHLNRLSGGLGDNVHFVFLIRWYATALSRPGASLFEIPWLNYPEGWSLASTDTSLAATLPGAPFALLFGDAAGYNIAMLLTFVLSGWAMFAWVRRLTASPAAGLFAGTLYAFLPYHVAHYAIGHLNLSSIQWFPLFFWGLYDMLRARPVEGRRWSSLQLGGWDWRPAALAGLSLGMIALVSMYYLYMTAVLAAVFVLGYLLLVEGLSALRRPLLWLNGLAAGLFALPLTAAGVYPFLAFARGGGIASRSVEYAAQYSASPTDFFLPFPGGLLWSRLMADSYLSERWVEQSLYIGICGLALAAAAWLLVNSAQRRLLRLAALCAAAGFILALGVQLNWLGKPLLVAGQPLPMPGRLLFDYAPFFDKMRALARFGFFVPFFTTLAAGLGAGALFDLLRPRRALALGAAALLIALTLLDFAVHPPSVFTAIGPRPVDAWLAAQPRQAAVAVFPFRRQVDQDLEYYAFYHGKPYIGGFFSANYPDQYWLIQPALDTFPSDQALEQLRALGVGYILVEKQEFADPQEMLAGCRAAGLPLLADFTDIAVFGLPPE
jgi:hypothetical protein